MTSGPSDVIHPTVDLTTSSSVEWWFGSHFGSLSPEQLGQFLENLSERSTLRDSTGLATAIPEGCFVGGKKGRMR